MWWAGSVWYLGDIRQPFIYLEGTQSRPSPASLRKSAFESKRVEMCYVSRNTNSDQKKNSKSVCQTKTFPALSVCGALLKKLKFYNDQYIFQAKHFYLFWIEILLSSKSFKCNFLLCPDWSVRSLVMKTWRTEGTSLRQANQFHFVSFSTCRWNSKRGNPVRRQRDRERVW